MFLSVSQSYFKHRCFGKTVLTVAVLTLSLATHAGPSTSSSGVVENSADKTQSDEVSSQNRMPPARSQGPGFPRWPQHQQRNKGIIPPPPPGPYTSSALKDYSVAVPSSGYHTGRSPSRDNTVSPVPMARFSPDVPWPTNLRPAQRQPQYGVSEQGSRYSKPFYGPVTNNNYGKYNDGNSAALYRNDRTMNASRWMPGMTMTPPGPYNNRLNYVPNYRSYYGPQYRSGSGSRYAGPAINDNGMRFNNPAAR